ncbi:bifunctional 2-polyprenyl-6-hydroxyphenol methylase/3-demethylubiquinol 3-O-methyltransferase UbiG [Roseovarius sp. EL26]|uniref:class I SAM-dependent methyltransferase n=1 Tax=Roseovarius sp. EL26 TaxID=2126672 RepID=UPI0013C4605A|nr:methyltransferase domain-containing protein [Roseovarius sp. EL26]
MGIRRHIRKFRDKRQALELKRQELENNRRELERLHDRSNDVLPSARNLLHSSLEPMAAREHFLPSIDTTKKILEVGPYFAPSIKGENVRYFDVFTTEQLRERAKNDPNDFVTSDTVVDVHFQDDDGDLSTIPETFDAAFSSHCIEHQPDLVRHLNDISNLLHEGGHYYLLVPDKQFCFDQPKPDTSIGDVLAASIEKRNRHTLRSLINHTILMTHNDSVRHTEADHFDAGWEEGYIERLKAAYDKYSAPHEEYIDSHAWQFKPETFLNIVWALNEAGLTSLKPESVWLTPSNRLEFAAILRKA